MHQDPWESEVLLEPFQELIKVYSEGHREAQGGCILLFCPFLYPWCAKVMQLSCAQFPVGNQIKISKEIKWSYLQKKS